MSTNRGYKAYFYVTGFHSPDEVSKLLGVEASDWWRRGDPITSAGGVRPDNAWTLEADVGYGPVLEDRLTQLVIRLEQARDVMPQVLERFSAGINVVAYLDEANPGFHLSAELIARVSSLRLSLDFDLYCLNDAREDDAG